MATVKLKIAELRKNKGIGQQDLAEVLGESFQSVSKWETGATMPDITLLPAIAEYFNVSVDELLGLKPLRQQAYIPRNTDNRDSLNGKTGKLYKNIKYFWNDDYLGFLVKNVWHVDKPVDVTFNISSREETIELLMNRGIDRVDAESYINMQSKIAEYFRNTERRKSFLKV